MLYWFLRGVLRGLGQVFFRWEIRGLENVPPSGPVLLAINHISAIDPFLGGSAIGRQVHFMAKAELFRIAPMRWILRGVGAFPVRRGESDRQAIRESLRLLAEGRVVGIFPEGTRSADGQLRQAQTGIAMLARRGKAAVVPMAISGTAGILPKGAWLPRPAKVRVMIGKALYPDAPGREGADGEATHDQLRRFADEVMRRIGELL